MALEVNFKIQTNTTRLYFDFYETTGAYSFPSNPGGYGAPNNTSASIQWATITVTPYGSTTSYTINKPVPPDVTGTIAFAINNTDIGLSSTAKIPDGLYNIKYEVGVYQFGLPVSVSANDYMVEFVEGLKCCLRKLRKNVAVPTGSQCGCEDKLLQKLSNAQALLDSICYLVGCNQLDRANEVMTYLEGFCDCNCQECQD